MRRAEDPYWNLGLGFGPVRNTAAGLLLPWETGPYSFLGSASQTPLTAQLDQLLQPPAPVALPPPLAAETGVTADAQAGQVRPPAVRPSHFSVDSCSAQEKRQAALSRWNYLLRVFPGLFAPSAVLQTVTGTTQDDLGMLDLIFS